MILAKIIFLITFLAIGFSANSFGEQAPEDQIPPTEITVNGSDGLPRTFQITPAPVEVVINMVNGLPQLTFKGPGLPTTHYTSAEGDLMFLAGNLSINTQTYGMSLLIYLMAEGVNLSTNNRERAITNDAEGVLRNHETDLLISLGAPPTTITNWSYDYGPSIPLSFRGIGGSLQFFYGTSGGINTGNGRTIQVGTVEVNVSAEREKIKNRVGNLNSVPAAVRDRINGMYGITRQNHVNKENYLKALAPVILEVAAALDRAVAVRMVQQNSPLYRGTYYRRQKLKWVEADANKAAAEQAMRTFLCRFDPEVIHSVLWSEQHPEIPSGSYGFPSGPVNPNTDISRFIEKYQYSCKELREKFPTEDFPYYPTTVNGQEMSQLIHDLHAAAAGDAMLAFMQKPNEGLMLYSLLAVMATQGIVPFNHDNLTTELFGIDLLEGGGLPYDIDRKDSIRYIGQLASNKKITEIALVDSGLMSSGEVAAWKEGGDAGLLRTVLNRYFDYGPGGSPRRLFGKGENAVRAELAHQVRTTLDVSWPYEFERKFESAFSSWDEAQQWCVNHGMAMIGEAERGYKPVKQRHFDLASVGFRMPGKWSDPYELFKATCPSEVWTEVPHWDSPRWERTRLNDLTYRPTLKFDRRYATRRSFSKHLTPFTFFEKRGVVCVSGTQEKRKPDFCEFQDPAFSQWGYPWDLKGNCYEDRVH